MSRSETINRKSAGKRLNAALNIKIKKTSQIVNFFGKA